MHPYIARIHGLRIAFPHSKNPLLNTTRRSEMNSSSTPSRSAAPARPQSRREFLQLGGGCAALSSTSFLSTLLNLKLTSAALAQTNPFTDYKALVCVFLPGGLDSFNLLTPYDTTEYSGYASARSGLALPKDGATPLQQISSIGSARTFGLHPAMPSCGRPTRKGKLVSLPTSEA